MDDNQRVRMLLGSQGQIQRPEFVRSMIGALRSLGFSNTARELETASDISYNPLKFTSLKSQIVAGNWVESAHTLFKMKDLDQETRSEALMRVLRMWMLECFSRADNSLLSQVLQENHNVFQMGEDDMDSLAYFLTHHKEEMDLTQFNDCLFPDLRQRLVAQLESLLPPAFTMPEANLESMVESALCAQRNSCSYHNSADSISLFEDHNSCGRDQLPTETVQILPDHKDEVWFVKFSNNGQYLASSSRDGTAIIWEVPECGNLTLKHILHGHETPVSFVSWSSNDFWLLTCGYEDLMLWDVDTGSHVYTYSGFGPLLSSCAWLPDGKGVLYGSSGLRSIHMIRSDEYLMSSWTHTQNCMIADFAITPNGKNLIFIFTEKHILIVNVEMRNQRIIEEESAIVSVSVSEDSELLMVNLKNQEIHMWDVKGIMTMPLKYRGHKQARFVIHSCFGGFQSKFIASGSEDSQVYIWNRTNGQQPLEVLPGHSMTVNCVSWNPKRLHMLASASDDRTIRIWGPSGIRSS